MVFKSDMAGELTIDWSKIQELRSSQKFAAILTDVRLRRSEDAAKVPQGTVTMTDQKLEFSGTQGSPQAIPVGNVSNLVDEAAFERAFHGRSFLQGWQGGRNRRGLIDGSHTKESDIYRHSEPGAQPCRQKTG